MAKRWNSLFAKSGSPDYSQLPTEEPSENNSARVFVVDHGTDYGRMGNPKDVQPEDVPMTMAATNRHTVQLGALSPLTSQRQPELEVPLTEENEVQKASLVVETEKEAKVDGPVSHFSFVEKSWFQAISAVIIISNVATTIVEMDKPELKHLFFISDQVMLFFYVVELYSRASFFERLFLLGPSASVCWNVLDIIVVASGVLDQWIMPVLPGAHSGSISKVLQVLRLLRLLRVFKIVRVFLDIDLSWTEAPAFQSFIGVVILVNSLLMGMEIDIPWHGWFYFEQILLCIYVFELSVRLKNFGTYFFSCDNMDIVWNILDFIIVVSSVLDTWITPLAGVIMKSLSDGKEQHQKQSGLSLGKVMMLMRMLRLMRILRLAKLVKSVRPLFVLVTGVAAACQGVAWVLVLTVVILYAMGILATSLIGKKMAFPPGAEVPEEILMPFTTVPDSMFTLFRMMSGAASDAEQTAVDHLMDNIPTIKLGFVFFMISSSWTLLSILTAVVSENMISTTGQQEEEHKIANAEEDRNDHVRKLLEVFQLMDSSGDGHVECEEIETFLADKQNAVIAARRCRVPVRDVREVLQTVAESCEGTTVSLETFVDHLADVSKVVTEKSTMKINAKINNLTKQQNEEFKKATEECKKIENMVATSSSNLSKLEKALHAKSEAMHKSQLKEVEKLVQGFAERTEASLSDIQQKNQGLQDSMTEALKHAYPKFGVDQFSDMLELQFRRMQHELLRSMRGPEADQEFSSVQKPLIADTATTPSEAVRTENGQQLPDVGKLETDCAVPSCAPKGQPELSAAQIEARLLATQESIHGLQHNTQSMLRVNEGFVEKICKSVDQGLSTLVVEKFSETLESELRMMRQELISCLGQQTADISKVDTAGQDCKEPASVDAAQKGQKGVCTELKTAQLEARVLANEESIHGLRQETEAIPRKIEGLFEKALDQGIAALAVDKFSDTLTHELHAMRRELLCSLGRQQPEVSKVRDGLQNGIGLASMESTPVWAQQDSSSALSCSTVEGTVRSSPCSAQERRE